MCVENIDTLVVEPNTFIELEEITLSAHVYDNCCGGHLEQ
jgi:hypothetical protein